MKFKVTGTRIRTVVTSITEEINQVMDISKAAVMTATGCPAKEDGDSTAWYGYVAEALQTGAPHKDEGKPSEISREETVSIEWTSEPDVDW
jgi:hypothetical protein